MNFRSIVLLSVYLVFQSACGGKKPEERTTIAPLSEPVRVTFFSGSAKVFLNSQERSLELGMELSADDRIETGQNGSVEVLVRNSGLIKISKNTSVAVSSIQKEDGGDTNVHLDYGKVVTIVKKEKKNETYNVVTPTLVAGVRGTTFMTSVENPGGKNPGIACAQEECVVRVKVLEGAVAVRGRSAADEVVVEKNSEIQVQGTKAIQKDWVKPLGKESLSELKEMLVFHKSDIGGFENLVQELKKGSRELGELDSAGSITDVRETLQKSTMGSQNDELRKKAEERDESKYLQKNLAKEKLKLSPKESF